MILNQPWKYSYEEEKFSSGGGGGPWTLPNLSMISWWVCCEFVYNFQLGNTITNTRYICRAFPPIVQQEFMQSAVRCLSSLSKLSVKKTTMRQKLAKFQALKSTLQCTYIHMYIHIYMHIYSCVHTHANILCVFLLFCFDHIWQRAERSTLSLSTHKHSTHTHTFTTPAAAETATTTTRTHSFTHSRTCSFCLVLLLWLMSICKLQYTKSTTTTI